MDNFWILSSLVEFGESLPAGTNTIGNVKITDGAETANVDSANNLNVVEKNSDAIKTAVEIINYII